MILDALLTFNYLTAAAASITSDAVDFGQADPRFGLVGRKFWVVVRGDEDFAATSVKVELEHSDDGTTFKTLASTPALTDYEQIVLPIPREHKRYLRLKYTLAGTPAGKVSAAITDNLSEVTTYTREVE